MSAPSIELRADRAAVSSAYAEYRLRCLVDGVETPPPLLDLFWWNWKIFPVRRLIMAERFPKAFAVGSGVAVAGFTCCSAVAGVLAFLAIAAVWIGSAAVLVRADDELAAAESRIRERESF